MRGFWKITCKKPSYVSNMIESPENDRHKVALQALYPFTQLQALFNLTLSLIYFCFWIYNKSDSSICCQTILKAANDRFSNFSIPYIPSHTEYPSYASVMD